MTTTLPPPPYLLADPSFDIRDEIASASGAPELPNKIWFHKTAAAVIDADRCVGCGSCIAACPSNSIGSDEFGKPTLVRMCTGCSACWDYCPAGGFRAEALAHDLEADLDPEREHANLGRVLESTSARAVKRPDNAQDGGVVTALLAELLEQGEIDGAMMTRPTDALHGEAFLATTAEEVRASAGSVYHQPLTLAALNDPLPEGVEKIAYVGTPCQISALRTLQRYPWANRQTAANNVVLTIALFCTRSFEPDLLDAALTERGVDVSALTQIDVREGKLIAKGADGELARFPAKEMRAAALKGCDECADFPGRAADLSVGSHGSEPGWTTILVRSEEGRQALEQGAAALDRTESVDLAAVAKTAANDRRMAEKVLARGYDPEAPVWVDYTEHLDAYLDTDRHAVSPPPFRSHHYQVNC